MTERPFLIDMAIGASGIATLPVAENGKFEVALVLGLAAIGTAAVYDWRQAISQRRQQSNAERQEVKEQNI